MGWLEYWGRVVTRAWADTWAGVVERSLYAIIRDVLLLAVSVYCIFWLKPLLAAPINADDSVQETLLWTIAGLISVLAVFAAWFAVSILFVVPYRLYAETKARADKAEGQLQKATNWKEVACELERLFKRGEYLQMAFSINIGAAMEFKENRPADTIELEWFNSVVDLLEKHQLYDEAIGFKTLRLGVKNFDPDKFMRNKHYWFGERMKIRVEKLRAILVRVAKRATDAALAKDEALGYRPLPGIE